MSRNIKDFAEAILATVRQQMFGVDDVIRLSLVALYTEGHVLLEGNPGLGKTELVKTLGQVLKLDFGRIQFTPDLMPSDITGTYMPDFDNRDSPKLEFRPGPIFTSLLLADEINRATPKTQSAMLEGMAEQQVTVLGEKRSLATPFMVLATQNPIDHEGTYNLPEAQADRFMFKIPMPIPDGQVMRLIMHKQAGSLAQDVALNQSTASRDPLLPQNQIDSQEKHKILREQIKQVVPLPALEVHILNMFLASNQRFAELEDLDKGQIEYLKRLVNDLMRYGLGPRAAIAMMLGAKAWSLMFSTEPDIEAATGPDLARVVIPTLRHRIKLELDWDDRYRQITKQKNLADDDLLETMLADFCIKTAPTKHGQQNEYHRIFEYALR